MDIDFSVIQTSDCNWLGGPEGASSEWGSLPHTLHGATPAGPCHRPKKKRARVHAPRDRKPRVYAQAAGSELEMALSQAHVRIPEPIIPVVRHGSKAEVRRTSRPTKRAAILEPQHVERVLEYIRSQSRSRESDTVKFLLSCKAGLRAGEIAQLPLSACLDIDGRVGKSIFIGSDISKSHRHRDVPMHPVLAQAIEALQKAHPDAIRLAFSVGHGGRLRPQRPSAVTQWFSKLYKQVGLVGASSHSGRRSFATNAARRLPDYHCTLDDLKRWLGHEYLSSTQCYLEPSPHAESLIHAL